MKTQLTILTILMTLTLFGQDHMQMRRFKTAYYNADKIIFKTKTDTIFFDSILDIDFYIKYFYKPYSIPNAFNNQRFRDTTIVVWADMTGEKDYKTNWTFTTVYDKYSRAKEYTYSGCLICGQFPYHINFFYDKKNRPIRMERRFGIGYEIRKDKLVKSTDKNLPDVKYVIVYDENNNIIQLKQFTKGQLSEQIDKL
jgi:hypothetical protein